MDCLGAGVGRPWWGPVVRASCFPRTKARLFRPAPAPICRLAVSVLLVLVATGCGPQCPRGSSYAEAAGWLAGTALPQESVAVPERGVGCFAGRSTLSLAPVTDAHQVLAELDAGRPDYVVAAGGVAWDGVRAQPWFIDRYRQLAAWQPTTRPDDRLVLFGYRTSPFDRGERVPVSARFESEAVALHAFRLSSVRVTAGEPLYVTLTWVGSPGYDVQALRTRLQLVEIATDMVWAQAGARLGAYGTDLPDADGRLTGGYQLDLPDDLPQGAYRLTVQLEEPSGRFVPVVGQAETALPLAIVERPPDVSRVPLGMDHTVSYTFGLPEAAHAIVLSGYDAPDRVAPGDTLRVALLWSATRPIADSYTVFVHLLAEDGSLVAQDDGVPVFGFYPTDTWVPGDYVRDQHLLELPAGMTRGDYALSVGLYLPAGGDRLAVVDDGGNALPEERVPLHVVRVR